MSIQPVHTVTVNLAVLAPKLLPRIYLRMIPLYVLAQQRILVVGPIVAVIAAQVLLLATHFSQMIVEGLGGFIGPAAALTNMTDGVIAIMNVEHVLAQRVRVLGLEVAGLQGTAEKLGVGTLVGLMPAQVAHQLEGLATGGADQLVLDVEARVDRLAVVVEPVLARALVVADAACKTLALPTVPLEMHSDVAVVAIPFTTFDTLVGEGFAALGTVGLLLAVDLLVHHDAVYTEHLEVVVQVCGLETIEVILSIV